ncbi:MFS transporter, partial [Enterobacter hormaechei]
GLSPLAPAWYVLALSLMGLVLGMWLRQSEGRRWRPPGPPAGFLFFNQTE